jgi:hypothetical protein
VSERNIRIRFPDRCLWQSVRYTIGVALGSALEALSIQNDNLTLPLYLWSVLLVNVL